MTIKYAVQASVPGALVWLDQDQRNKTPQGALHFRSVRLHSSKVREVVAHAARCCVCQIGESDLCSSLMIKTRGVLSLLHLAQSGMRDGVRQSQYFVLYLTEGIFSRYFCRLEIETVRAGFI